jgi:hypothetical protein
VTGLPSYVAHSTELHWDIVDIKKENLMPLDWSKREVANYIYGFFSNHINFFINWGCYLFNPEYSNDRELRNKIFCIYICALMDTLEGRDKRLENLKKHSESFKSPMFSHYCNEMNKFGRMIENMLRLYTKEEQILIRDFRNTLVHGLLTGSMQLNVSVVYFDGEILIRDKMSMQDYHGAIENVHPENIPLDDVLSEMCNRLLKSKFPYWAAMEQLMDPIKRDGLHKDIYGELGEDDYLSNEE